MSAPVIDLQPNNVTVAAGGSGTLTAHATIDGGITPLYQWVRYDATSGQAALLTDGSTFSGSLTGSLTIKNLSAALVGLYGCTASGQDGSTTTRSVAVLLKGMTLPAVTTQPADATAAAGGSVTLSVVLADADGANLTWLKNGSALDDFGGVTGSHTTDLTISGLTTYAAAYYQIRVITPTGVVLSESAGLSITSGGHTTPPQGYSPGYRPPGGVQSVIPLAPSNGGGPGIIITGGGSSTTAIMSNWQGISRVAAAGNAGRWLRDGYFSSPRPCGPPVPELPFAQWGDRLTAIWRQPWRVAIENWVAEPAYAVHPDRADYYLIKESVPEVRGAGIAMWDRSYAPVPQKHSEEEAFPYSYQYVATTTTLATRTRTVTSLIVCEYFLERDEAAFPLIEKDEFTVLPTTTLNASAQGNGVTLFKTGPTDMYLAPGTTFFVSNDAYIVAEPSKITTWNYPIMCRATRYVPSPTLADLGTVILSPSTPPSS